MISVLTALTRLRPARQVFVALLRNCQPDTRRHLVLQALDTLTPALVRRLDPGDARFPTWVRYTKKVLVEEGNSMVHLVHIWQLIVRHPQLFFSSRYAPSPGPYLPWHLPQACGDVTSGLMAIQKPYTLRQAQQLPHDTRKAAQAQLQAHSWMRGPVQGAVCAADGGRADEAGPAVRSNLGKQAAVARHCGARSDLGAPVPRTARRRAGPQSSQHCQTSCCECDK